MRGFEVEMNEIVAEMTSWSNINNQPNYVISEAEVRRRELVLIAREELCLFDDAKKSGDKPAENFHRDLFEVMKAHLAIYWNTKHEEPI